MFFCSDVIFKFCYIRKPFLIRGFCMKLPIQYVLCYELWIRSLTCAPIVSILNCRSDIFLSTNTKNPFVIYFYSMITFQIISYSAVSFIRRVCMYCFDFICNTSVLRFTGRNLSMKPFVISCSAYISKFTKCADRITVNFVFFFDRLINLSMSKQAQPRLLSISSSFFRNDASISAFSRLAFSNFNSARSLSSSVKESSDFRLPRLSCNASIPCFSYLTV